MTAPDITYRDGGLFVSFFPETDAGKVAWQEIADGTDGTAKVLSVHLARTLLQLRRAGYTVHKAKPVTMTDDELLAALI